MNTDNSLEKQLEEQLDGLNFIKIWFKGIPIVTIALWIVNILLLTKINYTFLLEPTIVFTIGITLSSIYMLIQANKIKSTIKKISHKIHIQEMTKQINKKNNQKSNTISKTNSNKKYYSYNPNNIYNNINLNNHNIKNYKVKRRVLKSSNIYTTKKSD